MLCFYKIHHHEVRFATFWYQGKLDTKSRAFISLHFDSNFFIEAGQDPRRLVETSGLKSLQLANVKALLFSPLRRRPVAFFQDVKSPVPEELMIILMEVMSSAAVISFLI